MTWTPDRPTKPGKYHVYVAPKNRGRLSGYLIVTLDSHDLEDLDRNELYAGALWRPYVEPADPHVRYQQEEERDELLRKPRLSRTGRIVPLSGLEVLALLDEVSR